MPAIRKSLEDFLHGEEPSKHHCNNGLWLDAYCHWSKDDDAGEKKKKHLLKAGEITTPDEYKHYFSLWKNRLEHDPDTRLFEAETKYRMIVGLGGDTPWENDLELHRIWAVPIIPGTALKGLASSYAHRMLIDDDWRKRKPPASQGGGDSHNVLFGTTDEQGCVIFHDALWMPGNPDNGLHLDTITVHHNDYYHGVEDKQSKDPKEKKLPCPTDFDSPNPIPFLSVSGKFLIALTGPEAWLDAACEILKNALENEGIGAKTNVGYGRISIKQELLSQNKTHFKRVAEKIEKLPLPRHPGETHNLIKAIDDAVDNELDHCRSYKLLRMLFERCQNDHRDAALQCIRSYVRNPYADQRAKDILNDIMQQDEQHKRSLFKQPPAWPYKEIAGRMKNDFNTSKLESEIMQGMKIYGPLRNNAPKKFADAFKKTLQSKEIGDQAFQLVQSMLENQKRKEPQQ